MHVPSGHRALVPCASSPVLWGADPCWSLSGGGDGEGGSVGPLPCFPSTVRLSQWVSSRHLTSPGRGGVSVSRGRGAGRDRAGCDQPSVWAGGGVGKLKGKMDLFRLSLIPHNLSPLSLNLIKMSGKGKGEHHAPRILLHETRAAAPPRRAHSAFPSHTIPPPHFSSPQAAVARRRRARRPPSPRRRASSSPSAASRAT
jgi:hypothetical protein